METGVLKCVFLSLLVVIATLASSNAQSQKLLVILLDGFRWDYVDQLDLPNFKRLYTSGARAGYLENDFPTLSYPNYYSLITGLHTENHGMTGNFMFDKSRQEAFLLGTNPEQYHAHWWDGGEPLWVTAVNQAKSAYMFYWLGCEVTIRNTTATFCAKYDGVPTKDDFKRALTESVNLLTNGTADLAAVYEEQPDYLGHKYGPGSEQLNNGLRSTDEILGDMFDSIEELDADSKINVIIFSDHGMTEISTSRVINITDTLIGTNTYITIMEAGAIASVYTAIPEQTDQVHDLLKDFHPNMTVYKREDIPERFHYKYGKYVGDVTCVADLGWMITQPLAVDFPQKGDQDMQGFHGYDNKEIEMRGIFYATGPYFKPGSKVTYLRAVDPYNLMCDILGLKPAPNNGSRDQFQPLVAASAACDVSAPYLVYLLSLGIGLVLHTHTCSSHRCSFLCIISFP